jgi:hypothetical protein
MMEGFGGIQEDSLVIGDGRAWYRIDLPFFNCIFSRMTFCLCDGPREITHWHVAGVRGNDYRTGDLCIY